MAVVKRVLCPQRLRRVPSQFSWIDHRLVQDRYIGRCSHPALALYLFLLTVCDGQGLSYWSDARIVRLLRMDSLALARARQELINAGLIAYQYPLYQVLALDPTPQPPTIGPHPGRPASGAQPSQPEALGQILKQLMQSAQ
jgi:hypothetical protein